MHKIYSKPLNGIALGLVLMFPDLAKAQVPEQHITCPPRLEERSLQLMKVPSGWTSFVAHGLWGLPLNSAGPMDGPPTNMAILKERSQTRRNGASVIVKWDLTGEHLGGKWMACNYGRANEVILSKQLDDKISECTVTATKISDGQTAIAIDCR